jgi:hypothetical protein
MTWSPWRLRGPARGCDHSSLRASQAGYWHCEVGNSLGISVDDDGRCCLSVCLSVWLCVCVCVCVCVCMCVCVVWMWVTLIMGYLLQSHTVSHQAYSLPFWLEWLASICSESVSTFSPTCSVTSRFFMSRGYCSIVLSFWYLHRKHFTDWAPPPPAPTCLLFLFCFYCCFEMGSH